MEIINNETARRFEHTTDEGATALLEYFIEDGAIDLLHTEVPSAMKGAGTGSALVKHALEYARENKLKVVPSCPFVADFIEKNPEYESLLN